MWCNLRDKFLVLLIVLLSLQLANACCSSNSTALIPLGADDVFFGMPVYYKSNMPIKKFYSKSQMENHIQQILKPLSPFIMGRDSRNNRNTRAIQRRQDTQVGTVPTIVELYEFKFPYIAAAQIGDYTFTCRQSTGELVIYNPTLQDPLRSIPRLVEFQLHPRPGSWWFVMCRGFETGGAGLGITGVQKPGGDQGIDPNALKSLVG